MHMFSHQYACLHWKLNLACDVFVDWFLTMVLMGICMEKITKSKRYLIRIPSSVTLNPPFSELNIFSRQGIACLVCNMFLWSIWLPKHVFFLVHWKHTDFCQPLNQHSFGFQLLTMTPQELTDLTTLVKLSTGVAWQEWNAFCEMRHPLYSKFIEADGGTHGWWPESVCFLKEIDFWGTCFVHFRDVFF